MSSEFDIIIVGGGTTGLVLAARLSEDPAVQVLVIEAGQDLTEDPRVTMPAMCQSLIKTSSNWGLKTIPQKHVGGRQFDVNGGRLLGGSSAINTFVFTPTCKAHVDAWASLGNPGWEWSRFSQSMAKVYKADDTPWGKLGEGALDVSIAAEETQWPRVWKETISNLGLPTDMNPFSGTIYGAYRDPETVHPTSKSRTYAASAYLAPARSRSNLAIWTEALAEKIVFDRTRTGDLTATGIQYLRGGVTGIAKARQEVILSGGAIQSPKLLELSGIGDPAILKPLGIEVLIDNPHVGENLQNHVYVCCTDEVVKQEGFETLDKLLKGDSAAIAAAQEALAKGKGPMTGANISASAQMPLPEFVNSQEGQKELDRLFANVDAGKESAQGEDSYRTDGKTTPAFAEMHESFVRSLLTSSMEASALYNAFAGFTGQDEATGTPLAHPPGDKRYLSVAVSLAHPLSRGSTHISSVSSIPSSPDDGKSTDTSSGGGSGKNGNSDVCLRIDPNYLSHPLDVEVLARHLVQVERIKRTAPLSAQMQSSGQQSEGGQRNLPATADLSDLEQARKYARSAVQGAYHFAGTCAQMPRGIGGVVDAEMRVYGAAHLRVCDMSIVPLVPRCNTQATAYAIGEHGVGILREALRQSQVA